MTKEITIKEGWYWSAGDHYWNCEENSREGVGLNRDLFNSEKITWKRNAPAETQNPSTTTTVRNVLS